MFVWVTFLFVFFVYFPCDFDVFYLRGFFLGSCWILMLVLRFGYDGEGWLSKAGKDCVCVCVCVCVCACVRVGHCGPICLVRKQLRTDPTDHQK